MKILNQNLQEGQKKEETKVQPTITKTTSKVTVKSQTSRVLTKVSVAAVPAKETNKPRITIKFSFTMDSFVIDMMTTISVSIFIFHIYAIVSVNSAYK